MPTRRLLLAAALLASLLVARPAIPSAAATDSTLTVCATCAFSTVQAAVDAARPGDTIRVEGGTHAGSLVVGKSVDLEGIDRPVLSAGGRGSVVHVTAPDVTLRGFVLQDRGASYDQEDSGVLVDGARARILDNEVRNDLFGIELRQAPDSQVVGNHVVGRPLDEPLRGDGLKVWYSPRTQIVANRIDGTRDCLLWYSDGSTVQDNVVTGGRDGFHFMQTNDSVVDRNRLESNSVGLYLMYGKNLTIRNNLLRANRGPSGDGIGVKEVDGAAIDDNVIVDNRVGIYVDNAPLSEGVTNGYSKYLGLALGMAVSIVLGFSLSALVASLAGGQGAGSFVGLTVLTVVLGWISLSVGYLISSGARRTAPALVLAVIVWLAGTLLGDLGLLGTALVVRLSPAVLLAVTALNPLESYRIAAIFLLRGSLDLLGPAGLVVTYDLGARAWLALLGILAVWLLGPLPIAYRRMLREDET